MPEITYDPEADAVYIALVRGKVERTKEARPFLYDLDAEGHIVGIEIPVCEQGSGARRLEKNKAAERKRAPAPPGGGAAPRFHFHQTAVAARRQIAMIKAAATRMAAGMSPRRA